MRESRKVTVKTLILISVLFFNSCFVFAQNAETFLESGNLNSKKGNLPEALSFYNKAITSNPKLAEAYYQRALIYMRMNNLIDAISDCYKAIEIKHDYVDPYIQLVYIHFQMKQFDKSWENVRKVRELGGRVDSIFIKALAQAYVVHGDYCSDHKDFLQAFFAYDRAIEIDPKDVDAYNNLGIAYKKQGNLPQAISNYSKAIEINPNNANAYWNLGLAYDAQGNLPQAIFNYTKDIEINPRDAMAYTNRGIEYETQGNLPQAISDYTKAIEIDPKHAHAYNNRADAYDKQSKYTQAIADFKKAIKIDPNYAQAYKNLGTLYDERGGIYYKQGDFSQAISEFTKAIEINPKDTVAYTNRGMSYYNEKEYDAAWTDVNKAKELGGSIDSDFVSSLKNDLSKNDHTAEAYYNLGMTYFGEKENNKAWIDLNKAKELGFNVDPAFLSSLKNNIDRESHYKIHIYYKSAYDYLNKKEYGEALTYLNKAKELGASEDPILMRAIKNGLGRENHYKMRVYYKSAMDCLNKKEYGGALMYLNKVKELGGAVDANLINTIKEDLSRNQ